MENLINEQSYKIISNKFFSIINYILPGIFILEVFFKKGFFSNIPSSLFEFSLFILWSYILSLPYNLINHFSVSNLFEEHKKRALKNPKIDEEKYLLNYEKVKQESLEESQKIESMIHFFYINVYLVLLFLIYKILTNYFVYYPFFNINKSLLIYFNTILIFFILLIFIVFPIGSYFENKYINKIIDEDQSN